MVKKLFLALIFFVLASSVMAISWPPEVKPEQGKAWTKTEVHDSYDGRVLGESYREISFWNVGQVSGNPTYAKAIFSSDCSKSTTPGCKAGEPVEAIFSGGPNGVITGSGYEYKLHDGKYFELVSGGKTTTFTVENPEIFTKYRWSMDESVPVPEIKEGKWKVETFGNARFNDLYGQVEINVPQPDGTYDEEAWDTAELDSELPPGTHIKVSNKSGLILTFPDTQTDIIVGPNTEIVLVSAKDEKEGHLQLLWGKLKANVKKMMKDGSLEVEMSQAVAGIKGTTFVLEETKKQSTLKVIEGSVAFKSKINGQEEMVNAGETLVSDKNGFSNKTTFDVASEKATWDALKKNASKTESVMTKLINVFLALWRWVSSLLPAK